MTTDLTHLPNAGPPDFEKIDAHITKALGTPAFKDHGARLQGLMTPMPAASLPAVAVPAQPKAAVTLEQVCAVYTGIRPMLVGLAWIPFIPKAWKSAIAVFVKTLDGICPTAVQ